MSEHHTEIVTRTIIQKAARFVPFVFDGGDLTPYEVEAYSRKDAYTEERNSYFGLGKTVFTFGGFALMFLSIILFFLSFAIAGLSPFQVVFSFLPLCYMSIGCSMMRRQRAEDEKAKKFSTFDLLRMVFASGFIVFCVVNVLIWDAG